MAGISYRLYLSHKIALHLVETRVVSARHLHGLTAFACYALALLVASALLHYLIERPSLRWRDRVGPARNGAWATAARPAIERVDRR